MLWFSPENLFKYSFITCYKSARNALNAVNAGCIFQVFEQKHKNSFSLHSIDFFINLKTHYNCFLRGELSCLFASEWICSAFPLRCTQCSLLLCLYWRSQGRYESIMMICIYNNIKCNSSLSIATLQNFKAFIDNTYCDSITCKYRRMSDGIFISHMLTCNRRDVATRRWGLTSYFEMVCI